MTNDFVHLHTHSEYSLLDGLGRIKDLVAETNRLGQPALGLTDHGAMHGAVEFYRACKGADVKPIIGIEAYETVWGRPMAGRDAQVDKENYHLLLLAENMAGYRNLLQIASNSQTGGYYYKPRVDHDFLAAHAEGLISTTGCLGAEVPQLIMQGKDKEAYERLGWYVDVFGKDRFFIEIQEHKIPELIEVNKMMVPWAEKFGIQLLVTNDVHYVREEDSHPHEVLLCVQTGTTIHDEKRMRLSDGSYFLKSRQQMEETFRPLIDLPASAFDNSVRIAEMCDVDLEDPTYHLPEIEIPDRFTYETYLRHLTDIGIQQRYGAQADDAAVQARKEHELSIIHQMGFDVYFIIVWDLCQAMAERNIWWNVRGSGAGSIVAYALEITLIDPLEHDLIFERFLNPGRISMPDFDLDIPDDSREEMIRYTIEKYGSEQVAQIVTFGRMKARAAVRDVGRAQDISLAEVDRIAKLIPALPGKHITIHDVLTPGNEFYNPELEVLYKEQTWVRELLDSSMQLEGVARHSGIHAAAVIVADKNLVNYVPLMRSSKGGVTGAITQYEFPVCESIGLLKVDFLGLATLSIMREAARLIEERRGTQYTLQSIPSDAPESYQLLASGEVTGIFQVESAGMRRILAELQPRNFEHVMAVVSLYRPGPLAYIPNFVDRLHGREEVVYRHPALEPILDETLGILVYQEQIMRIATDLAGYTASEADFMRKAVAKKKKDDLLKHRELMLAGAQKKEIPQKVMAQIFEDIEAFARYGFPKAHGADYALITVQTAYLKAIYPVEYMAALLLVERDKTDKVVNFINECRRMGIDVLPPDVNYSGMDFEIQERPADVEPMAQRDPLLGYPFPVKEGSAIRFGMAAVKNVGEGPVGVLIAAREEGGPFESLEDLCDRVDLRQVNKRALECLVKVGALDRFGHRGQLLAVLEQLVARSAATHSAKESGQLSMFDLLGDAGSLAPEPVRLSDMDEPTSRERLQWEKELLGVYAMSHPLQHVAVDLANVVTCTCNEVDERYDGRNVVLAGMIADMRTIMTKKGDQMAFVQLEDHKGQCEVVVFPRTYADFKDKLVLDSIVIVKGKGQTRESQTSLLADSIQNYVEQAIAVEQETDKLQAPLIEVSPTINGVIANGSNGAAGDGYDDNDEIDYGDFVPEMEENPFHREVEPEQDEGQREPAVENGVAPASVHQAVAHRPAPEAAEVVDVAMTANGTGQKSTSSSQPESASGEVRVVKEEAAKMMKETPKADESLEPRMPVTEQTSAAPDEQELPERSGPPMGDTESNGGQTSRHQGSRQLYITFRRSGDLARDKYRLKEVYDRVRDPRGRDRFFIVLESNGKHYELAFPNDACTISQRLMGELTKHFRAEVSVQEPAG